MDSTTKAAAVFAVLGILAIAGARICGKLRARAATSILVLGLNLVGGISLVSSALVFLVLWKGLARP
jgi:hypothetical protein